MNDRNKFIGINQRIPFEVLDSAILNYLKTGIVDGALIYAHMKEYTKGENRAKKATNYTIQIISRQKKHIDELNKHIDATSYLQLNIADRKAFVLCLMMLTFPIGYNLLVLLAKGFRVQELINKQYIKQKLAIIYGSNRTLDIAIDALLPLLMELKSIKRVRIGLFSFETVIKVTNPFISELITYTDIKLSGSKSILADDILHRPLYLYFDVKMRNHKKNSLIKFTESAVGQGYMTI